MIKRHFILNRSSKKTYCGRSATKSVGISTNPAWATCLMCRKLAILHDHLKVEDMTDRMYATKGMA